MSDLPICAADITPDWLNRVLTPDVRGGATATGVDSDVIGDEVGFLDRLVASFSHWVQPEVIAVGRRLVEQFHGIMAQVLGCEPTTFRRRTHQDDRRAADFLH